MIAEPRKQILLSGLSFLAFACSSGTAHAWGERGHHAICEVATRLVRQPELARFLESRGDLMGHLCNIPDIHWRNLGEAGKIGDATHFMNPENLDMKLQDIPEDYEKLRALKDGKDSARLGRKIQLSTDLGSLWWRADQFYKLGLGAAKKIPKPSPSPNPVYDEAVFQMMTNMGLMGHFVGDASMPYHNTADYDGWSVGRGGIHSYYETECVNALDLSLLSKVNTEALSQRDSKAEAKTTDVVGRMKQLSLVSVAEIPKIEAVDKVSAKSSGKIKAVRPSAHEQAKIFEPLVVVQLARSALLLANFWDELYEQSGKPDLSGYHSFTYPLAPEFVPPDYLTAAAAK